MSRRNKEECKSNEKRVTGMGEGDAHIYQKYEPSPGYERICNMNTNSIEANATRESERTRERRDWQMDSLIKKSNRMNTKNEKESKRVEADPSSLKR